MILSYFTGEHHSYSFEQIKQLAEDLGYSVRVYESKEANQFKEYVIVLDLKKTS